MLAAAADGALGFLGARDVLGPVFFVTILSGVRSIGAACREGMAVKEDCGRTERVKPTKRVPKSTEAAEIFAVSSAETRAPQAKPSKSKTGVVDSHLTVWNSDIPCSRGFRES